jgi:predicted dehydrogenase
MTALSAKSAMAVAGANERIRVGMIGCGNRGRYHTEQIVNNHQDVEIVALCDVDPAQRQKVMKQAKIEAKEFGDFRKMLEMKEIEAVFVVTPDHWHAIPAIMALQAGKDVFLEKPLAHTIEEGRLIVKAVEKYKRIFQMGCQQRSGTHWIHARRRIRDGEIGQITSVNICNAWGPKHRFSKVPDVPDCDPPPGVDYDMWLGPAPKREFNPAHWHFYNYFFFAYSGGMMLDWAVHHFDIATWVMGYNIKSVSCYGGKLVLKDPRDTPDTARASFDCGDWVLTYTMRHSNEWLPPGKLNHSVEFVGTQGVLQINRMQFDIFKQREKPQLKPDYTEKFQGISNVKHERNFFDCVKLRSTPVCDVVGGHYGSIPGHLANIAIRVGRPIKWDAEKETIPDDPQAAKFLTKDYREPWVLPEV